MAAAESLRAAWEGGCHEAAWAEYQRLTSAGEACVEAHLIGSMAARERGDLQGARWAIEKALEAGPTGMLLVRVWFQRGVLLREVGEAAAAVEQFESCLRHLGNYPVLRQVMEGPAWYNLGLALRQARRYDEAIAAYQRAVILFRSEMMTTHLCMALHNLAWVACLLGRMELAREALDESAPLCSEGALKWHQRIGEAFCMAQGGLEHQRQAMELAQEIIDHTGDLPADVRSHACWLAGTVALQLGLCHAAEDLANQAVHYAVQAKGENRCLLDAADLLREIRLRHQMHPSVGA